MDKLKQKSTKERLRFQDRETNKSLIVGSIIATFLALSPFLFTLYESVPDVQVWDTFLGTYESPYYESVKTLAWTLTTKITPLIFLTLWFLTNRHWWYHALLVPMAMYFYQIIIILNDDMQFADTDAQKLYLVPVMAVVIPSIYLIRARMFNKINDADKSIQELEEEFMMKPKGMWGTIKQYF